MTDYLLDTCLIDRMYQKSRVDVRARVDKIPAPKRLWISVITIGEFLCGHASVSNTDVVGQQEFRRWLSGEFDGFVKDVDESVSGTYGQFRAELLEKFPPPGGWGKKKKTPELCANVKGAALGIGENDLWLVAQAATNNFVLVTADKMDRLRNMFGGQVPIIYFPDDPARPAECSSAVPPSIAKAVA